MGTGSTLVAAMEAGRSGVGFEIVKKYSEISERRLKDSLNEQVDRPHSSKEAHPIAEVVLADSKRLSKIWEEKSFPQADYCITSPPYWNQLKRKNIRQRVRSERGLDTDYGNDLREIGNIRDYHDFLQVLKIHMNEVYKVMKPKGYLTVITNNVFTGGRMYPLAFDTVSTLSQPPFAWTPKDEKVWCQDDKRLLPLGVYHAWVGNRHHQYCLIFRKEDSIRIS